MSHLQYHLSMNKRNHFHEANLFKITHYNIHCYLILICHILISGHEIAYHHIIPNIFMLLKDLYNQREFINVHNDHCKHGLFHGISRSTNILHMLNVNCHKIIFRIHASSYLSILRYKSLHLWNKTSLIHFSSHYNNNLHIYYHSIILLPYISFKIFYVDHHKNPTLNAILKEL